MKKAFTILLFCFVACQAYSQSTWVQKLSDVTGVSGYSDQQLGVKDVAMCADGDVFLLARTNQDSREVLVKIAPDGKVFRWLKTIGGRDFHQGYFSTRIVATPDSGVLLATNFCYHDANTHIDAIVRKYNNDGTVQFEDVRPGIPFTAHQFEIIKDVVLKSTGGYRALINDSIYGTGSNTLPVDGNRLYELPNGDLMVRTTNNNIIRIDTMGNTVWSAPCNSNTVVAFTPAFIFLTTTGFNVKKVNVSNGSAVWTKPSYMYISHLEATADGGYIGSSGTVPPDTFGFPASQSPGSLVRADSSGDTLWTRSYALPYGGLSVVGILPGGNLLTGGSYLRSWNCINYTNLQDYGAFYATLDSNGHGILDSTYYMWPGDANNNQLVDFVDDALYMVIANGDTGLMRDTLGQGLFTNCSGDFATDWSTSFSNGVNVTHSDFDGNGIVDTNDVAQFRQLLMTELNDSTYIPLPFRSGESSDQQSAPPDFRLTPVEDTVATGEDAHFLILAGSISTQVDSICGLAFAFTPSSADAAVMGVNFVSSDLGNTATELYTTSFPVATRYDALTCRTDHVTVYNLNDTLGVITANENSGVPAAFRLNVSEFKALTCDGTEILFNIISDPVTVIPGFVSVHDASRYAVSIYPNPAADHVYISMSSGENKKITLFTSTGQKVKNMISGERRISLYTGDLKAGYYTLEISSDTFIHHHRLMVTNH